MTSIKKLVMEFEEKNSLNVINKQVANRNFLIVFSFFCGATLKDIGVNFPIALIFLIIIGLIFTFLLNYFFDKQIGLALNPWLKSKCEFIDNKVKYSSELRKFRELNPTYDAYEDLNVYLIEITPRNLTVNLLFDVNQQIKKAFPHLKTIIVKE
jgi:hypothetical protein